MMPSVAVPVATALIAVVGMFLRYMATEREKDRLMWTNHMTASTAALQQVALQLERLAIRIEESLRK